MLDERALKNSATLSSWRAWEAEACQRSGFNAVLGGVFALTLAFVIFPSLFSRALGDDLVPIALIGLVLTLGTSFALMVLAVLRMNAWKRANPWTPPS